MSRSIRIALLTLTLVLCIFASMAQPAVSDVITTCGSDVVQCHVSEDCDAHCQVCGYLGFCIKLRSEYYGSCACHT